MYWLKWSVALGLVAVLAGFLIFTDRQTSVGPPPALPVPAQVPAPPATKEKRVFTQSLQCKECHQEIYTEWSKDQHANAWTEDIYKFYTKNYTQLECLTCHAPQPLLEVGLATNVPKLRDTYREEGVDCLACHIKNGLTHGTLGSKAVCGGILEPELKTSQACYHCHSTHNLFKEYLASEQYKQGVTCQDCHMAKVTRPVAEGSAARVSRRHLFHAGGHDPEALKKSLKLDLAVQDGSLVVTVTNIGAAHGVPGEINNRTIRLEVSVLVKKGTEVVDGKETDVVEEVQAHQTVFRAPPRLMRDKIPSTQIMPGDPRVIKYELRTEHGKAIATLAYKLEPSMLNSEATPMNKTEFDF